MRNLLSLVVTVLSAMYSSVFSGLRSFHKQNAGFARVTNPFLSMDASGTVGKSLTACKWKGRNYMRKHFIPAFPNSAKQQSMNEVVKLASQEFAGMTTENQELWNDYGALINNSGIARFMKAAIDAAVADEAPDEIPTGIEVANPETPTSPGITWTFPV